MPTAGRLVAAVLMCVLAWYASDLIKPLFPEGTQFGLFNIVNAGLGLIMGWVVVGSRLGLGARGGIGAGITGGFGLVISGLFINSGAIMIDNSLKKRYDGPMEAVVDVFSLMIEHAQIMATGEVIGTLAIGSILIGLLAEAAARRWR